MEGIAEVGHRARVDQLELLDIDHLERGQYNDGGYVWQGQELEVGEKEEGKDSDGDGTNNARESGCSSTLDVEGGSHQSRGAGHATEESGEKVCERQCHYLLALIELGVGHPICDPTSCTPSLAEIGD